MKDIIFLNNEELFGFVSNICEEERNREEI